MAAIKEVELYLSFNGRREISPLPNKLTDLGKESLAVLADVFHDMYKVQHSLMLDSRNDVLQCSHFAVNEERFLSAEHELRSAVARAKSGVLLPVVYEADREIDFAPQVADFCDESSNDFRIGLDKTGHFCATINPSGTRRRSYLSGITRKGIAVLTKNAIVRTLWIDLLIRNSFALRGFKNEFSSEDIWCGFEKCFNALSATR